MKEDVGMSHHEKEGNKKMPTPRQKIIHNPIPTSLYFNLFLVMNACAYTNYRIDVYIAKLVSSILRQRCRDGVMNEFRCRHLLVPFFFMM